MTKLTLRDLEDARLLAEATYAKFKQDFDKEVNKPDVDLKNAVSFKSLTPETKEQWKNADPESYKLAEKKYGGA
jgi:hypothetical protein